MGFRSLVSLFLVLLPIGATLGVLLGLDQYRTSKGLTPIFQDNSIDKNKYCQKSYGISPLSVGQRYTFNPNQWNWNPGQPGHLCMDITTYANETYATRSTAPEFSVTWHYPQGDPDFPVHAFPNIAMDGTDVFPTRLGDLKHVPVNTRWTYGTGQKPVHKLDQAALKAAGLNANVAIDMFLDSDRGKSQQTTGAKYEVMVWLGKFGDATDPIGADFLPKPVRTTRVVDGITFELYSGKNSIPQNVLTWVATTPANNFKGDISQLMTGLQEWNGPGPSDYLGYMGLGSETYFTAAPVTFWVPRLEMQVKTR